MSAWIVPWRSGKGKAGGRKGGRKIAPPPSYVCTWKPVDRTTSGAISQMLSTFGGQDLSLVWNSPIRLDWLFSMHHSTQIFFKWMLGLEFESSCEHLLLNHILSTMVIFNFYCQLDWIKTRGIMRHTFWGCSSGLFQRRLTRWEKLTRNVTCTHLIGCGEKK